MTRLTRNESDPDNGEAGLAGVHGEPRAETWTGNPQLITRLATVGLWLMLAAGPLALALVVTASPAATRPPPVAPVAEIPDDNARPAVEEFAQRLVVDWIQTPRGQEDRLVQYGLRNLETQQPQIAQQASFPAVAGADEIEPGLWSVTVGVTVTDPAATEPEKSADSAEELAPSDQSEPEESAGPATPWSARQYFQISVEHRDGLLAAQTLPSAVPAPAVAGHSALVYDEAVGANGPLGEAVAGFLSALLAGRGDVSRYTAANSQITAAASQPYLRVEVTGVRADDAPDPGVQPVDGDRVRVLVTAVALTRARQEVAVQFPLTLIARPGRWEVVEIDPAARRVSADS